MGCYIRSLTLATISLAALGAATSDARAGAFALREQSATAQGLSFAGAASGSGGLSSMFWNPATITMAPGWQSEFHASVIIPEVKIKPLPPTPTLAFGASGDIGEDAVVPTSYLSYQFNDSLWLGLATTAPFGRMATSAACDSRSRMRLLERTKEWVSLSGISRGESTPGPVP